MTESSVFFDAKAFLALGLLLTFSWAESATNDFPYEPCDWTNRTQTRKLTDNLADYLVGDASGSKTLLQDDGCNTALSQIVDQDFSDQISRLASNALEYSFSRSDENYSPLCFLASTWRGKRLWSPQKKGRAYYHCSEGKTRPHTTVMDDKGKTRNMYNRSFCHNRNYIQMISKAFNEVSQCFGLDPDEKRHIFALFNHESSFQLNKRSNTGARCLGQMTMTAFKDINRDINNEGRIAKEVFGRCPKLAEEVIPPEILQKNLSWKGVKKVTARNERAFNCSLTHNPYACLFYSIYFLKHYENILESIMEGAGEDHFPASFQMPQDIEERFGFPIQMGEIFQVKGTCQHPSQGELEGSWLFQRNDKAYDFLQKCGFDRRLNTRKVELFEGFGSKIKLDVLLTSYNGGSSILMTYFPNFIRDLKERIVKACTVPEQCPRRKSIEKGRPLSSQSFLDDFGKYLLENYNAGAVRRKEVAKFSTKVSQDLGTIGMGSQENRNILSSHLEKVFGEEVSGKKVEGFIKALQKNCPNELHRAAFVLE